MKSYHFTRSKFAAVMSYESFVILDKLLQEASPLPSSAKVPTGKYFTGKGSNLLTAVCIKYLKLNGHFAERTSNTGQVRRMKDGSMKYTYGSGTNEFFPSNSSSNHYLLATKSEASKMPVPFKESANARLIEREAQKKYQKEVEKSHGTYLIVRKLDTLIEYIETLKTGRKLREKTETYE